MKYSFALIALLPLLSCCGRSPEIPAEPEKLSSQEQILRRPDMAGGLMYVYDYKTAPALTPSPKGYKPFYISHYGRHGARYATNAQYKMVEKVLRGAAEADMLTERGKKFQEDYSEFFKSAVYHDGELTPIGIEQEKTIALRMASRFPEVFKGETNAVAISTPVHRVILSMASFIDGLQEVDKSFDVDESYSEAYSPVLRPNFSPLADGRPDKMDEVVAPYIPYFRETVDIEGILARIFVNPKDAVERLKIDDVVLLRNFADIVGGEKCLGDEPSFFEGIFTAEDRVALARAAWYRIYRFLLNYKDSGTLFPDFSAYTLKDIVDKADEDIASGDVQLRLRFSHDSALIPFVVCLNLNGFGESVSSPEEAFERFPLWEMPMGGSFQMIFYRSRKAGDVLVKFLWNEKEASIPIDALEGPYYRWSDVRAYCQGRIDNSLGKIGEAFGQNEKNGHSL
ncbi:MAG: histidine-type phosphatase [Bacteroidales bacterium]|nr:histidine-type phosphatase [Bacteroidales bacterium]